MDLSLEERRPMRRELRRKYVKATKGEKGCILDQLEVMGYSRGYGRRLMREGHRRVRGTRRGAPATYGAAEQEVLRQVWLMSDCLCGKRLAPIIGEYVRKCVEFGEIAAPPEVCAKAEVFISTSTCRFFRRLVPPGSRCHPAHWREERTL